MHYLLSVKHIHMYSPIYAYFISYDEFAYMHSNLILYMSLFIFLYECYLNSMQYLENCVNNLSFQ